MNQKKTNLNLEIGDLYYCDLYVNLVIGPINLHGQVPFITIDYRIGATYTCTMLVSEKWENYKIKKVIPHGC